LVFVSWQCFQHNRLVWVAFTQSTLMQMLPPASRRSNINKDNAKKHPQLTSVAFAETTAINRRVAAVNTTRLNATVHDTEAVMVGVFETAPGLALASTGTAVLPALASGAD
jgi:hypothetical protein